MKSILVVFLFTCYCFSDVKGHDLNNDHSGQGSRREYMDMMMFHRSVELFYKDWVSSNYGKVNFTQKQMAYYTSLDSRPVSHDSTLADAVKKIFSDLQEDLAGYLQGSHLSEASEGGHHRQRRGLTNKEKKERREKNQALKESDRPAWRALLKERRQQRREKGKFQGPGSQEARKAKWQRKMDNKNGDNGGAAPSTDVNQPPPPPGVVAAPPPIEIAPPIPKQKEKPPTEKIPVQNPNKEVDRFESPPGGPPVSNVNAPGSSKPVAAPPPPKKDEEKPTEKIPRQDPEKEANQFKSPPPVKAAPPPVQQVPALPPNAPPVAPAEPVFEEQVPMDGIPVIDPNNAVKQFEGRKRRKRSLGTHRRPEWRQLSDVQYKNLLRGIQHLMTSHIDGVSQYDVFVETHRLAHSPNAYSREYRWNRDFINRFESALQQFDRSIVLPYIDICAVIQSGVTSLPARFPDNSPVIKDCSWIGTTLKRTFVSSNTTVTKLSQLLGCSQQSSAAVFGMDEFATLHSLFGPCVPGGSHLACPSCAVSDPLYWFLYADIDRRNSVLM